METQPASKVDRAIAIAWAAIGAITVLTAIAVAYLGSRAGVPYRDQWDYVDPPLYLSHLFALHAGQHPIVFDRLLFAVDYYVFDARGWFLQCVTFMLLAAETAAFMLLARLGGVRSLNGALVVAGFAATLIFNPHASPNLIWGFQPTFVLAFAASVGAAYALATYAAAPRVWKLVLSLACSVAALLSLANGVFISALLVVMALYLRLPRHVVVLHALVVLIAFPIFFGPGVERFSFPYLVFFSPKLVLWGLAYLGGGLARVADTIWPHVAALDPIAWSIGLGVFLFAASAALCILILFRKPRDPVAAALVSLILFIGMTAYLTAVGRTFSGLEGALSGRYATAGAVLIIALGIGGALFLGGVSSKRVQQTILAVGAALALLIPLSGGGVIRNVANRQQVVITAARTALVVGAADSVSIQRVSLHPDEEALLGSTVLRAAHKWHFRDRWSRAIGEQHAFDTTASCAGGLRPHAPRRTIPLGYLRLQGWIDGSAASRGRIVVIANRNGQIVGYGLVAQDISDMVGGLFAPPRRAWSGHALVETDGAGRAPPLQAYLANEDAIACRIG